MLINRFSNNLSKFLIKPTEYMSERKQIFKDAASQLQANQIEIIHVNSRNGRSRHKSIQTSLSNR